MFATYLNKKCLSLTLSLLAAVLFLLWADLAQAENYTVESLPNVHLSDRTRYLSDPDGLIGPDDRAAIDRLALDMDQKLGVEVAVVVVRQIADQEARQFATELFNHWGLGKKGRDNGLLILLVTEPPARSVTFETGYGLEGVLPDIICYRLQQQYMIPDLGADRYGPGLLKGLRAVSAHLFEHYSQESGTFSPAAPVENASQGADGDNAMTSIDFWLIILMVAFIVFFLFKAAAKYRPRICPKCGQKRFRLVQIVTVRAATRHQEGLQEYIYRCSNCQHTEKHPHTTSRLRNSDSGGFGGGGFGGGGGGGGGGSWGGGRSGGGGASSRF